MRILLLIILGLAVITPGTACTSCVDETGSVPDSDDGQGDEHGDRELADGSGNESGTPDDCGRPFEDGMECAKRRAERCAATPPEECESDPGCVEIVGSVFDEQRECWRHDVVAGCLSVDHGCISTGMYYAGPEDKCWWISGCVPQGWEMEPKIQQFCGQKFQEFEECK